MKKIIFTLAVAFYGYTASAQSYGNAYANSVYNKNYLDKSTDKYTANASTPRSNAISLEVSALMNVTADDYVAIFNITQIGPSATEVDSLVSRRINNFKKELERLNIPTEKVLTDMISLIPVFEIEVEKKLFSKTYNEVPKGFELMKNLHVHFKDPAVLDQLITAAAKNEIYDIVKVDYFIENTEAVYDQLRKKSIEVIQKKTAAFKDLGVNLDTIYHTFSEDKNVAFPADRYKSYQAYSSSSLEAIHKKKGVTTVKKPTTKYYSKLPSHKYDIIINETVVEPAVQFTYNLKITYIIKEKTPTTKKQFYIITDDGNLKLLDIQ